MTGLGPLIVRYWKELGLSVTSVGAAFAWLHRNYKAQRQKRLDSKVLEALGSQLWTGNRPFTGAGETGVRAVEIAERLAHRRDDVADSLERLEAQGKATRGDGTLADPAPYWFVVRR